MSPSAPRWIVYILKDPRTSEVRYVGWTSRSATKRMGAHVRDAIQAGRLRGSHKNRWVLSLLSIGLRPVLEVIESGTGPGWAEAERRWIATFREKTPRLLNRSDGGEGNPGCVFSGEARRKISQASKSWKRSPEHIAKWIEAARAANKGRRWSAEQKAAQVARLKGIPRPAHVIAKFHANNKGKTLSAETRAKIAKARTGSVASPETRAKMSASAKLRAEVKRGRIGLWER